jgi:hypothetical protein
MQKLEPGRIGNQVDHLRESWCRYPDRAEIREP